MHDLPSRVDSTGAPATFLEGRIRAGEVRELDPFVAARSLVGMLMIFLWTQHVLGGEVVMLRWILGGRGYS